MARHVFSTAFYMNIGAKFLNPRERGAIRKDECVVHAFEGRKYLCTFTRSHERTGGPLILAY